MSRILLESNGRVGRVLVDDVDLSRHVSAVKIEWPAGEVPRVHLTMLATELSLIADDAQVEKSGESE